MCYVTCKVVIVLLHITCHDVTAWFYVGCVAVVLAVLGATLSPLAPYIVRYVIMLLFCCYSVGDMVCDV